MKYGSPIRVLHLAAPGRLYGAERWVLALINNIDRTKIDSVISVIRDSPNITPAICKRAESLGFETAIFNAYGKVSLTAIFQIRKYILSHKIDVLHTHWYKADIIGLLAAAGTKCRIVSTPHGWSMNSDFKLRCYEAINRLVFPFFDAVAPVSSELFLDLCKIPGLKHKARLIENGVDLNEITSSKHISDEIAAWKQNGRLVIGYIGQLIPRKGIDILLKAFASMNYCNTCLAIIGSGEQMGELQSYVTLQGLNDRVKFFGFRDDRLDFLRGFDIFVLPSKLEGIPRCVMEAMAAGVAVVVSDIPGCLNLVMHNINGLVFKNNKANELSAHLDDLVRDESLRLRLSIEGKRYVLDKFSAERMAREYLKLYYSLYYSEQAMVRKVVN